MTDPIAKAQELLDGLDGVTPGPWECESTKSDGSYGAGDDVAEGFDAYQVIGPPLYPGGRDVAICDTINSDCASVAEEWDEDGSHSAWDEQGRKNLSHIARCDPDTIASICRALIEREAALEVASDQEIRLHLGELTAQEMRTVKAYANWRKSALTTIKDTRHGTR